MSQRVSTKDDVRAFFAQSEWLDRFVLRPLSHITLNWELTWDAELKVYEPEEDSFAADLNCVIDLICNCHNPANYHKHEDVLANYLVESGSWPTQKKGSKWIGANYQSILEQGAFQDYRQIDLIASATGRVYAALRFGQLDFDSMEDGHRTMLAAVMTIILYHRLCDNSSLFQS
jgi:hypothetical protein